MSGPSRAPNAVAASSNETPCLRRLPAAFRASHSNTVQYIRNSGGGPPTVAGCPLRSLIAGNWLETSALRVSAYLVLAAGSRLSDARPSAERPIVGLEAQRGYGINRRSHLICLVAGARSHSPANRSLEFRFEIQM